MNNKRIYKTAAFLSNKELCDYCFYYQKIGDTLWKSDRPTESGVKRLLIKSCVRRFSILFTGNAIAPYYKEDYEFYKKFVSCKDGIVCKQEDNNYFRPKYEYEEGEINEQIQTQTNSNRGN